MNVLPIKEWGFPGDTLFLAAGPCSAESEAQVLQSARELSDSNISFLRAGIWKPRTRPGSFEGIGKKGLDWLVRAREETGLKIGTEVAEPAHVEAALAAELDILWVGARTTTNPFSVQAIADVLRGTDIPVLVKNPISPDIGLWIGAVERLHNAGIRKLGVIHRGFHSSLEMRYRNAPHWKLPIELRRRFPELSQICDPSHICGKSELIHEVAQEAIDLLFDGLMVEVHPNPAVARSDADQQLTPSQFNQMLDQLIFSHESSDDGEFLSKLSVLRGAVDQLDARLLELLSDRMQVVQQLGALKQAQHVSTLQPNRWKAVVEDRIRRAQAHGLSEDFVLQIMQSIHEEAIRQQEKKRLGGGR